MKPGKRCKDEARAKRGSPAPQGGPPKPPPAGTLAGAMKAAGVEPKRPPRLVPIRKWPKIDKRPEAVALLRNIKRALPGLRKLKEECEGHWGFEDSAYRFYHQSLKVFYLQDRTEEIVKALQALAPKTGRQRFGTFYRIDDFKRRHRGEPAVERPKHVLHPWFEAILAEGTGKEFKFADNQNWLPVARPIVEAYCHAKYFLDMAVKYGAELRRPPNLLPNGWAAILYLYDLR